MPEQEVRSRKTLQATERSEAFDGVRGGGNC